MFEYQQDLTKLDYRAEFANSIFKLLLPKYENNVHMTIQSDEFLKMEDQLQGVVKNIYELVDCEIPLMGYYQLIKYRKENYSMNEEKYDAALDRTIEACKLYYGI